MALGLMSLVSLYIRVGYYFHFVGTSRFRGKFRPKQRDFGHYRGSNNCILFQTMWVFSHIQVYKGHNTKNISKKLQLDIYNPFQSCIKLNFNRKEVPMAGMNFSGSKQFPLAGNILLLPEIISTTLTGNNFPLHEIVYFGWK